VNRNLGYSFGIILPRGWGTLGAGVAGRWFGSDHQVGSGWDLLECKQGGC
jgi:hypothetical protein